MIGGQVLIIFVGGQAFSITPLDGKEWGLSIGLGAISLPWGVVIRKFPDEWAAAMVPKINLPRISLFGKKPKQKGVQGLPQSEEEQAKRKLAAESDTDSSEPTRPLRTLTSIRGKRAETNIKRGFREYMHDQKAKVKAKAAGSSKTDLSGAGARPAVEKQT